MKEKEGIVLSVTNQKGGVGKTTTAVNLASYLSENNAKVLLVDMDPQANATSGVGIKVEALTHSVYDVLFEFDQIENALVPTAFNNLHLLPSSTDLAGAQVELVSEDSRETRLKYALDQLRPFYDYIIIDCPPSLGLLTVNSLVASDRVIIPLQCEYYAMEGIAGLLHTLNRIKDAFNPTLEIAGIVLTMFDRRTTLNKQVEDNTRRFFKGLVFDTVIPRNIRLSEAPSHGLPIALYNPVSRGAEAYESLAKEVMQRV